MGENKRFVKKNCYSLILIMFFIIILLLMFSFIDTTSSIIYWFSDKLLIFATVLLVFVTYIYTITSRRTMWHNALSDTQKDYRSPEMMYAIQRLWDFSNDKCNKTKKDLIINYWAHVDDDKAKIDNEKNLEKKNLLIKDSLNAQRRVVSHFYYHLSDLLHNNILTKEIVFSYWHEENLKIIQDILIPLEEAQALSSNVSAEFDLKKYKYLLKAFNEYKQSN